MCSYISGPRICYRERELQTAWMRFAFCRVHAGCVQAFMWFNLVAMCVFLAHKASGVVFAILETFGRRPDAARANGREDSADEAWVEGRLVLSAFEPSRPVRHSREGHGIAIAVVDSQKDMAPYLICFKSGLAKWCVLQPAPQSLLFGTCTCPAVRFIFWLRRYSATELVSDVTVQLVETRAWALPSVAKILQVAPAPSPPYMMPITCICIYI